METIPLLRGASDGLGTRISFNNNLRREFPWKGDKKAVRPGLDALEDVEHPSQRHIAVDGGSGSRRDSPRSSVMAAMSMDSIAPSAQMVSSHS